MTNSQLLTMKELNNARYDFIKWFWLKSNYEYKAKLNNKEKAIVNKEFKKELKEKEELKIKTRKAFEELITDMMNIN